MAWKKERVLAVVGVLVIHAETSGANWCATTAVLSRANLRQRERGSLLNLLNFLAERGVVEGEAGYLTNNWRLAASLRREPGLALGFALNECRL